MNRHTKNTRGAAWRWLARLVRPLCWPFMAIFELLLLLVCWGLALRWPVAAGIVADLAAMHLPDPSWYWPNDQSEPRHE